MVDSKEEFNEPETIVDRLRGIYSLGFNGEFGERDFSSSEFIKPINLEAARRIEQLEAENKRLSMHVCGMCHGHGLVGNVIDLQECPDCILYNSHEDAIAENYDQLEAENERLEEENRLLEEDIREMDNSLDKLRTMLYCSDEGIRYRERGDI